MTFAIDPKQEIIYTLEADKDLPDNDKGKPRFILKPLTAREHAAIEDGMMVGSTEIEKGSKPKSQTNFKPGSSTLEILDKGLVRWENFYLSEEGPEIDWPESKLSKNKRHELYTHLTKDTRTEIADAITEMNNIDENEVKN